jgi:hypothetical protein
LEEEGHSWNRLNSTKSRSTGRAAVKVVKVVERLVQSVEFEQTEKGATPNGHKETNKHEGGIWPTRKWSTRKHSIRWRRGQKKEQVGTESKDPRVQGAFLRLAVDSVD